MCSVGHVARKKGISILIYTNNLFIQYQTKKLMKIATEPVGSIPRPAYLIDAMGSFAKGQIKENELNALTEKAIREILTI